MLPLMKVVPAHGNYTGGCVWVKSKVSPALRPSTSHPTNGWLLMVVRPPNSWAALEGASLDSGCVAVGAGNQQQVPGAWPGVSHGGFILPLMVF